MKVFVSLDLPYDRYLPQWSVHRVAFFENSIHETNLIFGLSSRRLKVAVVSSFQGTSRQ
jgi:hypothetical protein